MLFFVRLCKLLYDLLKKLFIAVPFMLLFEVWAIARLLIILSLVVISLYSFFK